MLCCRYSTRLIIVVIAPLTPIAAALKLDDKDGSLGLARLLSRVYMQGQAVAVPAASPHAVAPSDASYNFRIDMPGAIEVFEHLQLWRRPVSLLGKHAAYQVTLTKQDLQSLDDPCLPSLMVAARDQMREFKRQNPDQFFHLFPVPEQFRSSGGDMAFEWFDHLPNDIVSHPYDALAVLMAEEDASSSPAPLFARARLSRLVETVGNSAHPASHGVNDALAVKLAVMAMMRRAIGLARCAKKLAE